MRLKAHETSRFKKVTRAQLEATFMPDLLDTARIDKPFTSQNGLGEVMVWTRGTTVKVIQVVQGKALISGYFPNLRPMGKHKTRYRRAIIGVDHLIRDAIEGEA